VNQQQDEDEWEENGAWRHKRISQDTTLSSVVTLLHESRSLSDAHLSVDITRRNTIMSS